MNLLKLLGFGVLIWDVVFITDAVLNSFSILPNLIMQTTFIVITIITFLLTENLNILSVKKIIKYGLVWALVMILLDVIVASCCLGWDSFYHYDTWINYSIVVLMPIFTVKLKKQNIDGQS